MEKIDIQRLRELPIESVAERLGFVVNRHKSLCPFHDDRHPSLSFSVARNTFRCFVCNAHGGVIDLAMHVLNKGFRETCEWLAGEHSIILTQWKPTPTKTEVKHFDASRYSRYFEHPFINQKASEFLYDQRRLDPRVVRWCRLTSWKDWLQIPYFDTEGRLTGVQWRYLGNDASQPRFRFPYGSQCHIYNKPVLRMLHPGEPLYITEGCSDCWSMLSSGHKAIAIPSATLLKPDDLAQVRGRPLHIYPDQDEAGERLYQQLVSVANDMGSCLYRHDLPLGCKDYSDFYLQLQ